MKPLCIDLYCGLGGWTEGFLAEGYDVLGFDTERHVYGDQRYPAQLVLQDVLTLCGSQFRNAALIVASPPCQAYSYMAMPWTRAKRIAEEIHNDPARIEKLNRLFNACFRIQREACEAAAHHIPIVVENVKGAQPWVGRAAWHYGSFYLWGDVPALMPATLGRGKVEGVKLPGHDTFRANGSHVGRMTDPRHASKNDGGPWFARAHNTESGHSRNPVTGAGIKQSGLSGPRWFDEGAAHLSSRSSARKVASAQIAKVPFELASWIARVFKG